MAKSQFGWPSSGQLATELRFRHTDVSVSMGCVAIGGSGLTARSTRIYEERVDGHSQDLEGGGGQQVGSDRAQVSCGQVPVEYRRIRVASSLERPVPILSVKKSRSGDLGKPTPRRSANRTGPVRQLSARLLPDDSACPSPKTQGGQGKKMFPSTCR